MKSNFSLTLILIISLSAYSAGNISKEQNHTELSIKRKFTCTATQGLQSVNLPILTNEGVVGKIYAQKPLRLSAKPFDILFNAIDVGGTSLQLMIQADTDKFEQAARASYWGPYPTEKMHVELSRYAAKISCF